MPSAATTTPRRTAGFAPPRRRRRGATHVVLFLGEPHEWSGESATLAEPRLPAAQRRLVERVRAAAPAAKLVVFVTAGRALHIPRAVEEAADALFWTAHTGSFAGEVIAEILSGACNPSARLSHGLPIADGITSGFDTRQARTDRPAVPVVRGSATRRQRHHWCAYYLGLGARWPAAYTFGEGYSYTTFALSDWSLDADSLSAGGDAAVTARVRVTNTGDRAGTETVHLYYQDMVCEERVPRLLERLGHRQATLDARRLGDARLHGHAGDARQVWPRPGRRPARLAGQRPGGEPGPAVSRPERGAGARRDRALRRRALRPPVHPGAVRSAMATDTHSGGTTWVIPLAGQSNMVSRADADGSAPWPEAVRFVTQDGRLVAPAPEIATPEGNGGPFLIAKCFARDFLASHPGDSLVFVPGAVGGTSFWNHRWNPGDDLYDNLVALTRGVLASHPGWRLRAMLFQGFETDAKNGMLVTTFRRVPRPLRPGGPRRPRARPADRLRRASAGLRRCRAGACRHPRRARGGDPAIALHRRRLQPLANDRRRRRPALLDRRPPRDRKPLCRSPRPRRGKRTRSRRFLSRRRFPTAFRADSFGQTMPTPPIAPQDDSVVHQLRTLARAIHRTPGRSRLYLLSGAIVAIIVATAAMQVRLNAWNQPFYDAISRRDLDGFVHQLGVFFVIAAILLVLNVAQTAANQLIRVRLRALATQDLIGNWMTTKRAARIGRAGEIGVNPDQRIQADTQTLTEQTTDLGIGLLQSSILLASFIGVLWMLSAGVVIPIGDRDIAIPGYMVWAALLYAISGSVISWRVGRPLVRLGADRYAQEAAFRSTLVQASERAEGIVLSNGEADSRRGIEASLDVLVGLLRQVAMARTRLTWVTAGYGWVAIVFPIIVAAPGYFAGRLTFGELMMVVGAFNQVQSSLRWFVDNTGTIADWRAALLRVMNFRQALLGLDAAEAGAGLIERTESEGDRLTLEDVRVESRHGSITLDTPRLEIAPGERVLILGKPGSGRTTFFLAIAGLWNAGSGRIGVPPDGAVAYLTQRPFLPSGPLRAVLASDGATPGDDVLRAALERSGLGNLADSLDHDARWDRELGIGEQERLGYARLLVARPKWLVCDEGLDPLDDANRQTLARDPERRACGERRRQHLPAPRADGLLRQGRRARGDPARGDDRRPERRRRKRGSGRRRSDDGRKRAAILELTLPGIGRFVSRGKSARVETGAEHMAITEITPSYSVSPQITPDEVAGIQALGFRSILCNRPDGESADQTPVAEVRAEAERLGLGFAYVPVVSGQIDADDVTDFRAAIESLPKPVLAYCRSGARCQNLWLLAER